VAQKGYLEAVLSVAAMRQLEAAADASGYRYAQMMQAAGAALAQRILARGPACVLILVGKGNNGGDGLVAAAYLKQHSPAIQVGVYLALPRQDELLAAARQAGAELILPEALGNWLSRADVLVDALLGTGFKLPLADPPGELLAQVGASLSHHRPTIVAADCPSGLDCDSGQIAEGALRADETVCFAALKPGLLKSPGKDYAGQVHLVDIGIPEFIYNQLENSKR
jgi:NAD(P)H-hydrate epimerase